jgi:hypothetical protein
MMPELKQGDVVKFKFDADVDDGVVVIGYFKEWRPIITHQHRILLEKVVWSSMKDWRKYYPKERPFNIEIPWSNIRDVEKIVWDDKTRLLYEV